jgi:hypothetical protein
MTKFEEVTMDLVDATEWTEVVIEATEGSDTPPARERETNPNSLRQQILATMLEVNAPMTTKEIKAALKEKGVEFNWIHSHIAYFKSHAQVVHNEDGTYVLAKKVATRLELVQAALA